MLNRVTLTGADNTVNPKQLIALSKEFTFIEWGLLIGSEVKKRFPSPAWLGTLQDEIPQFPSTTRLSMHLCGRPLREILFHGRWTAGSVEDIGRMQLNVNSCDFSECADARKAIALNIKTVRDSLGIQEIIVQLGGRNDWLLDELLQISVNASGLYDRSGGTGVKPSVWPIANPDWRVGYAGGIGPETIRDDVLAILDAAGERPTWIDLESKLRTPDDKFGLATCRFALEQCREFVV